MTALPDDVSAGAGAAPALTWAAVKGYFTGQRVGTYIRPLPDHGVVYVKNPKAACSTLLLWLDRMHTGEHDFAPANVHRENRLPTIGDVGRARVLRMLSGQAYRFSFVRHPLRRVESAYRDKLVTSDRYRPGAIERLGLPGGPDRIPSFDEFLAAVEQQDPVTEMDPHWRPQHVNLMHPLVSYDRVGHLESFAADLETIRQEAGLPHVPLESRNHARVEHTDSVFDGRPDLVRRVERLYATDFELYGY